MEQTTLLMVLGGLLILTLMLASIAHRYHAYLEERRRQIERILRRVGELEELVTILQDPPVEVEVSALLRRDILARLKVIRQVHARYPGIGQKISAAESALTAAGQREAAAAQLDERTFERLMHGLGQVHWMLQERRFVTPLDESERESLMRTIALRRADFLYRFHSRQGERLAEEGQLHQALWHFDQVQQFLRDQGPDDDAWRARFTEVVGRCREITEVINGQSSEPSPEAPSE